MQVWTVVAGKIASIASGNPLRPSTQQIRTSLTPRCLSSQEDLHPELRAFAVLKPHAEHVALAVDAHAQSEVARFALDRAAFLDLEHERVEEDDRVYVIQRPLLPSAGVVHHRVSHPRDQIAADVDAVELAQVALDVAGRQPTAVEREDLLVKAFKAALAFAHKLGLKAAVAIAGRADPDGPVLGHKRLGPAFAVARVPRPARRLSVRLIAQVIGQLDLERSLHQTLGQLPKHAARPKDLLLGPRSGQQLVNDLVRKLAADVIRHAVQDPRRGRRRLAYRLAAGAMQIRAS